MGDFDPGQPNALIELVSKAPTQTIALAEAARSRANAYQLFGRLFLEGVTQALVPFITAIPELEAVAPQDLDRVASDHYRLFGYNIFPYESAFLQEEIILEGLVTSQVGKFAREVGYNVPLTGEAADHIGSELTLLAFLCAAEADAWEAGSPQVGRQFQGLQRRFLDEHLLRWMSALVQAVRQQGAAYRFFIRAVNLAFELAVTHRLNLGPPDESAFRLPGALPDLEHKKTNLKEIVQFLLTPARSGFYLSRDDIGKLGRRHRLPRGFGDRRQMLLNLLRVAADYEMVDRVIVDLADMLASWKDFYREAASQASSAWQLADYIAPWSDRLDDAARLIEDIRTVVAAESWAE